MEKTKRLKPVQIFERIADFKLDLERWVSIRLLTLIKELADQDIAEFLNNLDKITADWNKGLI